MEAWRHVLGVLDLPVPHRLPVQEQLVVLPSRRGWPLPSSPLLGELPSGRGRASRVLMPWRVSLLPQEMGEALPWLLALPADDAMGRGVLLGSDVRVWAASARFARSLAIRGRFLPDLDLERPGEARARWTPVFIGEDRTHLARLAGVLPPGARAPEKGAEIPAAETVLRLFLDRAVDALVRGALSGGRSRDAASADDAWVAALGRPGDPVLGGTREGRGDLAARLRGWRRPLDIVASSSWRLAFRLEEPSPAEEEDFQEASAEGTSERSPKETLWRVVYLLQSVEDPSLFVPLRTFWDSGESFGLPFRGAPGGRDPREYALAALGQAARFCPLVDQALRRGGLDGHDLDADGVLMFLGRQAPLLEDAGFSVLAPGWWRRKHARRRLGLRARIQNKGMAAPGGMDLDTLVDVRWEILLGNAALSLEELEDLARHKRALVRLRGEWVHLSPEEIRTCLELLRQGGGRMPVRDVLSFELGASEPPGDLVFEGVVDEGALGDLLRCLEGTQAVEELPEPVDFSGTLRPYQRRGFGWISFLTQWGLGACLADDMGLGKTVQTLAFLQRHRNEGHGPVLLVCPTSVIENWRREMGRFTPLLRPLVHHGGSRQKGEPFARQCARADVVLTSYALLGRDSVALEGVGWSGVVLDEAQNIKNPDTRGAQVVRRLRAGFRLALTGTPVENSVGDLWSLLSFLNPGLLGNRGSFERRFLKPIQREGDQDAAERLRRLSGPFVLRRLKTDRALLPELPEKVERDAFCSLTREQASLYRAVTEEAVEDLARVEGLELRGLALGTMIRLKQICNHPAHFLKESGPLEGRSGKMTRLGEILEEVFSAGDRALIFTQFAEMGALIRAYVGEHFGQEALFLHGGVPKVRRDAMVARFQEDSEGPRAFVLSLKAGGTGLNLTRANHVVLYDRWWNPAVESQAVDRAFRIGQARNVQVHRFLCSGTLEEKVVALLAHKRELATLSVATGESWLASLSAAELRQLFTLEKGVVEG